MDGILWACEASPAKRTKTMQKVGLTPSRDTDCCQLSVELQEGYRDKRWQYRENVSGKSSRSRGAEAAAEGVGATVVSLLA